MVFHMRAQLGGTYLSEPDGVKRLEAKINGKVRRWFILHGIPLEDLLLSP